MNIAARRSKASAADEAEQRPLIAHVLFRFDYGGLENGIVNLINGLDDAEFRHVVVALTESTSFRERLRDGIEVFELHKRPGKDFPAYGRLFRLLRRLRPAIVHTRNFGTLDCTLIALLAGVPVRIHGEHGWDIFDPDGRVPKYRLMRRALSPLVHGFVTVSKDLRTWLSAVVGIPPAKITWICNGVNTAKFRPRAAEDPAALPAGFRDGACVIGTVTRFSAIKDPLNLVEAFIRLRSRPDIDVPLRLVMIGDGELRDAALAKLRDAGLADAAWLPGSREDIPQLLRELDVFVLGSLREGISNTILEAMASGVPVVATATGGSVELIDAGRTGQLVAPGDAEALADAIAGYALDPELGRRHGRAARHDAETRFSLATMIAHYRRLYQRSLSPSRSRICAESPE